MDTFKLVQTPIQSKFSVTITFMILSELILVLHGVVKNAGNI